MAIEQVQNLPQQYVTDLGVDYGKQLAGLTSLPINTDRLAPQVAGQDALQTQAYDLASSGVGAYAPYLAQAGAYDTSAAQYGTQAGTSLNNAGIYGGQAGTSIGNAGAYGTAAGAYSGPQGYTGFESPYQQDVINASLAKFDQTAGKGMRDIGLNAAMSGNLGGGREGVMKGQYQADSDMNRALLESGLMQTGFAQSNQFANQAFNQQNQLGRVGGVQQLQSQAVLDAQREANRLEAFEPYERLNTYGSGIGGLFSGNAPFGNQSTVTPNPTPLQTALGTASVLSGIFGGGNQRQRTQAEKDAGF